MSTLTDANGEVVPWTFSEPPAGTVAPKAGWRICTDTGAITCTPTCTEVGGVALSVTSTKSVPAVMPAVY
jgi:hypothetical protein